MRKRTQIKPSHKAYYNTIWRGRTWEQVIDLCIGTSCPSGGSCGLNAIYMTMDKARYDFEVDYYYVYGFVGSRRYITKIPLDLSEYVETLCKERNFTP